MSATRVESASEIVDVGEKVWIKVIGREVQGDKIKLAFSMKAVNQGTGRDLDPNHVMAEQDARRRRQFRDNTGNRITLEAVLNTTCTKCGCKGHFTKDCYSAPGLQYSLVPDEVDGEPQQQQQQLQVTSDAPKKDKDKKKKKKEKKMKKKRKRERKETESDDSSGGGGECKPKRRCREQTREREEKQQKKKHKKHKSHKHS